MATVIMPLERNLFNLWLFSIAGGSQFSVYRMSKCVSRAGLWPRLVCGQLCFVALLRFLVFGLRQVRVVEGSVNGIRLRFIDTPGLHASSSMIVKNQKILSQVCPWSLDAMQGLAHLR